MKRIILLSLILIFSLIVYAVTVTNVITSFNNSLSSEVLNFTAEEHMIRFLDLPSVNVQNLTMTINVSHVVGEDVSGLNHSWGFLNGSLVDSIAGVTIANHGMQSINDNNSYFGNVSNPTAWMNFTKQLFSSNNFTLATKLKIENVSATSGTLFLQQASPGGATLDGYIIRVIDTRPRVRVVAAVDFVFDGNCTLQNNTFFDLVVTTNQTTAANQEWRIYVDGEECGNSTDVNNHRPAEMNDETVIGSSPKSDFDQPLNNVEFGEIKYWNRTLNEVEVKQQFLLNGTNKPLKLEVGDPDSVAEWTSVPGVQDISINVSTINNVLAAGCSCDNCTFTDGICSVPFTFQSESIGIMEYSNILANTSFGLDQCESFNTSAFNFTIRDETTGAVVVANATFSIDFFIDPGDVNTLIATRIDNSTYPFCKFPSYANLTGNVGATLTADGRESSTFSQLNVPLQGIFDAFMLATSASVQQVLYIIVDDALSRIEGARMTFQRIINGTLQTTFEGDSDFRGQVVLNQDSNSIYTITLNATGFPFKTFDLQPILTTYTIRLTEGGTNVFDNQYSGFRYKIIPPNNLFNVSDDFLNFTFIVEGNSLELWGINLTRHNFICEPADCSATSTSATGGNVTVAILLNTTGRFYTDLFFKKTGQNLIRINSWPNDAALFDVATRSIIVLMDEIRENTSPNVRAVLVASIQLMLIGIASSVGVIGFPLVVIATFILAFFSLPMIGFIHPLFGLFMVLSGIIMYVFSQRNA